MAKAKRSRELEPIDNGGIAAITLGGMSLGSLMLPGTIVLAVIFGVIAYFAAKNIKVPKK